MTHYLYSNLRPEPDYEKFLKSVIESPINQKAKAEGKTYISDIKPAELCSDWGVTKAIMKDC